MLGLCGHVTEDETREMSILDDDGVHLNKRMTLPCLCVAGVCSRRTSIVSRRMPLLK
jgi:hypothetical protein